MEHTYEELKEKTVAELREIAKGIEHEALKGFSTMHKEDLIEALCKALGIEPRKHHEVVGIDKAAIKTKIKELKKRRDAALASKDAKELRSVREKIRLLKRKLRRAMV